jgi:hypothetical protein
MNKINMAWRSINVNEMSNARRLQPEQRARSPLKHAQYVDEKN